VSWGSLGVVGSPVSHTVPVAVCYNVLFVGSGCVGLYIESESVSALLIAYIYMKMKLWVQSKSLMTS
jgi:hypothetical protein